MITYVWILKVKLGGFYAKKRIHCSELKYRYFVFRGFFAAFSQLFSKKSWIIFYRRTTTSNGTLYKELHDWSLAINLPKWNCIIFTTLASAQRMLMIILESFHFCFFIAFITMIVLQNFENIHVTRCFPVECYWATSHCILSFR